MNQGGALDPNAPAALLGSGSQGAQNLAWGLSMNHRWSARFWTAPVLWRFGRTRAMGGGQNIAFSFIAPPGKAAEGCRSPRRCRAGLAPVHGCNAHQKWFGNSP